MSTFQTFHAVDDAVVHPAEVIAFFVDRFAFPLLITFLSKDSREARFTLGTYANPDDYLKRAERIVKCLRLPLTVSLTYRMVGGLVADSKLIVKYTGQ